jgi:hypothetical protein
MHKLPKQASDHREGIGVVCDGGGTVIVTGDPYPEMLTVADSPSPA